MSWLSPNRRLILASASPRRSELLSRMGFTFEVTAGDPLDEESFLDPVSIEQSITRLAEAKGQGVAGRNPGALVLSADTVVVCGGVILGKPADDHAARRMLRMLSGRAHQVMSAVALTCEAASFQKSTVVCTDVFFRELSDPEIGWYVDSGEPSDKAGGYGIQGKAMIFVDKIEGCFYNVVGLPVQGTIDLFKEFDAKGIP